MAFFKQHALFCLPLFVLRFLFVISSSKIDNGLYVVTNEQNRELFENSICDCCDYTYTIQYKCSSACCVTPRIVTVENAKMKSVEFVNDNSNCQETIDISQYLTMDEIFVYVRELIDENPESFSATYDDQCHIPTSVSVSDNTISFSISDFTCLDQNDLSQDRSYQTRKNKCSKPKLSNMQPIPHYLTNSIERGNNGNRNPQNPNKPQNMTRSYSNTKPYNNTKLYTNTKIYNNTKSYNNTKPCNSTKPSSSYNQTRSSRTLGLRDNERYSDETRPSFNRTRSSFNHTRQSFNHTRPSFNETRSYFNHTRPSFNATKWFFNNTHVSHNETRPTNDRGINRYNGTKCNNSSTNFTHPDPVNRRDKSTTTTTTTTIISTTDESIIQQQAGSVHPITSSHTSSTTSSSSSSTRSRPTTTQKATTTKSASTTSQRVTTTKSASTTSRRSSTTRRN